MAEGRRRGGGICGLLDLIEEHRGAVEYDFRARFQLSLEVVPEGMGWGEAIRLLRILRADPSSAIAASLEGWDHPITREALAIFDLYDLTVMANHGGKGPKPKPHNGRPFKADTNTRTRVGDSGGRSRDEVVAYLNSLGHNLPV